MVEKMAKRTSKKNPPLYERAKTGRLEPCPGEAHTNPFIDNCALCAPRWGKVEELEPMLSLERVVEAVHAGYDVDASDVADDVLLALLKAGVKLHDRRDKEPYGYVSFNVVRIG